MPNDRAANDSIYFANKLSNIDLSSHRSRKFNLYAFREKSLVLTMTEEQADFIRSNLLKKVEENLSDPTAKTKENELLPEIDVYSIKDFVLKQKANVKDPFGRGYEAYEMMAYEIYELIEKLVYLL